MKGPLFFALAAEYLDVIYINIWSIIVSLANLLILYLILKKLLFKPVTKVVSARREKVDGMLREAQEAKEKAEQDRETYAAQLSHAQEDAAEVMRRAAQSANRTGDEIIRAAETRAQEMLKRADEDIAQEKKKAVNEMKEELSGISLTIAEKVVGREIKEQDHKKLIDDFISEVGEDHE